MRSVLDSQVQFCRQAHFESKRKDIFLTSLGLKTVILLTWGKVRWPLRPRKGAPTSPQMVQTDRIVFKVVKSRQANISPKSETVMLKEFT